MILDNKKRIVTLLVVALVSVGLISGAVTIKLIDILNEERQLRSTSVKSNITEIFHDQANEYMVPLQPTEKDDITIRLRTEKYNVTKAQIQYTNDKGRTWNTADMSFEKHDNTGYFDIWAGKVPAQDKVFYYRFICANDTGTYFVNRNLIPDTLETNEYDNGWCVLPGFSTPDWAKGALWYNLSPDAFYNGDISGDTTTSDQNDVNSWNNIRRHLSDKYGGDLKGIADKSKHINSLYADAVFMNPFNKAYQNCGYGPIQYDQVEPTLGNAQNLKDMVTVLHKAGLKVGSDAVLTFTPQNSIYFDQSDLWPYDGASENENSEYKEMYSIYHWPNNYHLSWAGPALDHSSSKLQNILYGNKNSYLQYYTAAPYSLDSWRFDCGGWLYGRTESDYLSQTKVLGTIKKNLVKTNPDIFLVSEFASNSALLTNTWDSQWNISLMGVLRSYSSGLADEGTLVASLDETLNCLPRAIALGIYNCVVNHDEPRLDDDNVPSHIEKSGLLTLMTYIGSPSIYYGEEINLDRDKEDGYGSSASFYAMEWDESNWDYERYNLYRSLGELRSKYSALKTGAVKNLIVDNARNLYAFGRFDKNGSVITVASQNADVTNIEIKARTLGIKNGTVVTDWLTGEQYKVDNEGLLHLKVIPGGSVFVTGKESSNYRSSFEINNINHANGDIYLTDSNVFTVNGSGKLSGSDKITFASHNIYGAGYLQSIVDSDGSVALTIRQDASAKSASYNLTVKNKRITVTVRDKEGKKVKKICESKFKNGSAIRIYRDGKNNFTSYIAEVSEKGNISGDWKLIEGSSADISMEYQACAGFAPISGDCKLTGVTVNSNKDDLNFADFNGKTITAMFDYSNIKNVSLKDGKLALSSNGDINCATTYGKDDDWTFKAKLDSSVTDEGKFAGVICRSGDMQWVSAGRTVIGDKPVIFFGSTSNGIMQVDSYVSDLNPEKSVVIQLQRIGSYYTLAYSYDEKEYHLIDDKLFANFSDERIGIFVSGKTDALFDYVCFGDSINDKVSTNVPYSNGVINVDYSDSVSAMTTESTKIVSGNWEYAKEGYYQTVKSGTAQLGLAKKVFKDFKLNLTVKLESGEGYAAIGFGKTNHDTGENDGFLLKYTRDGKLFLNKNGTKMAEVKVADKSSDGALRLIIEAKNSNIRVYAGQNATKVISIDNTGYNKGCVSFYTVNTAARFMNNRITDLSANWNIITSTDGRRTSVLGGVNTIVCTPTTSSSLDVYGAVTLMGSGVTDLATSLNINVGSKDNAEAGLLIAASEGKSKAVSGINVALIKGGDLIMRADGKEVSRYSIGNDVKAATIMVIKKDRVCNVYLKGISDPVMTYEDSFERGGVYQLYAVKSTARFSGFGLEDIHNINVEESIVYQLWNQGNLYSIGAKTYRENFNNYNAWASLKTYYNDHGKWTIENGVLSCIDSPNWASGVTIYDHSFENFKMEFNYRFDESSSNFAGVLFNKSKLDDTNESAEYSLLLYSSGEVAIYNSTTKKTLATGKVPNFKVGEFYRLKLISSGGDIAVYYGDNQILSCKKTASSTNGFISFASNRSYVSFDDVLIEPLK